MLDRFGDSQRLWLASRTSARPCSSTSPRHGEPIRYRHAPGTWPLDAYQQIFGTEPGSAEMPSAARPFTAELVVDLARRGVTIAPILLHTGVSSLEAHEMPYPERYRVPEATAAHVNAVHAAGGRVIAVGTTVVRALETVDRRATASCTPARAGPSSSSRPSAACARSTAWSPAGTSPRRRTCSMLEAIAGRPALERAYAEAHAGGYLWHEFGDSHLLLPDDVRRP